MKVARKGMRREIEIKKRDEERDQGYRGEGDYHRLYTWVEGKKRGREGVREGKRTGEWKIGKRGRNT